jgi:hypothetical protein
MTWLSRLFRWFSPGLAGDRRQVQAAPRMHDFGGAIGALPMVKPTRFLFLHVTADGRILLDNQPVPLTELEAALKSAYQPGAVVYYSRENPGCFSPVAPEIIACLARLGIPYALPSEATPTIDRVLRTKA